VIWLAGMAAVLATPTAADILDDPEYDTVLLAVWTFIAGGLYGVVGYFVLGFALYFGVRLLGSLGSFRRARQTVGFALVPLALSLLLVLPLRLALYGGDTFRGGFESAALISGRVGPARVRAMRRERRGQVRVQPAERANRQ